MIPGSHVRAAVPIGEHDFHFDDFLESAPDAVVIMDGSGAIARANSQTEKLFGYRRDELVGAPSKFSCHSGTATRTSPKRVAMPRIQTRGRWESA